MLTQIELSPEIIAKRKRPKIFMRPEGLFEKDLNGVELQWTGQVCASTGLVQTSPVVGLSLSGVQVRGSALTAKFKLGSEVSAKLKFTNSGLLVPIKLIYRELRQESAIKWVGFALDSISTQGRLTIDQVSRDEFIKMNLMSIDRISDTFVIPQFLNIRSWWHGPFDTNFAILIDAVAGQMQFLVEYDGLLVNLSEDYISVKRSPVSLPENVDYFHSWSDKHTVEKISLGTSWIDRVLRLLNSQVDISEELRPLILQLVQRKKMSK
jgi:hypothetical protein